MKKEDQSSYVVSAELLQEMINIIQELPAKNTFRTLQKIFELTKPPTDPKPL